MDSKDFSGALGFISDWGKFDEQGMKAFTKTFESKLKIPSDIKDTINTSIVNFGTLTVNFIFGAMFILLTIIVWILVPIGVLTWGFAVLITVIIALFLWIAATIYRNSLNNSITEAMGDVNSKMGVFTEEFAQNVFNTLGDATKAYNNNKVKSVTKEEPDVADFEF